MFGRLLLLNFDIYYIKYGTKTDVKLLFVLYFLYIKEFYRTESQ